MGSIENSRIANRNHGMKTGEIIEEASTGRNTIHDHKMVDIEGSAMESVISANSRGGGAQSLKYSGANNRENSKEVEMM
jgi:hypothetical protein